jgi:hypothetical protein
MVNAAYDFADTSFSKFAVSVWYNSTYNNYTLNQPPALIHVARSMNMVSDALVFILPVYKWVLEMVLIYPSKNSAVDITLEITRE